MFSDGPKPGVTEVEEVRRVVKEMLPEARLIASEQNKGLARSITEGVSRLTDEFGAVIVIEDDLVLAPQFLTYMDSALATFAAEDRVLQVSGFSHDVDNPPATAGFLPMTSSWGWATWKRAWATFDLDASGARAMLSDADARRRFDLGGAMPYSRMLERQLEGEIDSWAVKFYLSVFERNGFVLYPPRTLVDNKGFDGSGTHGAASARVTARRELDTGVVVMPQTVEIDSGYYARVCAAARRDYGSKSVLTKVLRTLRRKVGLA